MQEWLAHKASHKMCVEVLMGPLGGLTLNFPSQTLSKFCENFPIGLSPCKYLHGSCAFQLLCGLPTSIMMAKSLMLVSVFVSSALLGEIYE